MARNFKEEDLSVHVPSAWVTLMKESGLEPFL